MIEKKPILEFQAPIVEIITETPSTKTLVFDIRGTNFDFYPGQYVMLEVPYPPTGELLKRAYSIANSPLQKDRLELTVKKTPNGKASVILTEHVKVGDTFKIKGPYGKFVWLPEMSDRIVLISAGSGIVPLMCILRYIVSAKLYHVKATLLYSNTSYEEIIYREELERMKNYPNIKVVHTLTRSVPEGWKGYTGRINPDMILKEVQDIPLNLYYLCGPPKFVDDITSMLLELGVDKERIKKEKYD
ncbi:ferredoxin reductase [Hydrogenobacter hydrogenophilus]|uniref:Ferredoxin-NADP reductase n=1 Tax=Hydrogenobacter hydrogenophilus TaxID=35835 RepID=A0A285NZS9_9AQUI|nr:ferredoxin reductase [Hydrogenobacter hydrogenophilus]SNZ14970.1 Ferredoxin-NADP reductase [Hydrogenobacter hydrogenophilus]